MPLPQGSSNQALRLIVKKYVSDALNPVFQGMSEIASKIEGDQTEIRTGLLEEIEAAFGEIIAEKKLRAGKQPQHCITLGTLRNS